MTSLPPPLQSVLELFQGPLSSVRFADIDAAGLAKLAAEVEAASSQVQERENELAELRQALAQRQEALLALAQQALAYARVYAENDEPLLEAVNRISLPRATKPRKAPTSAKGGARDAATDAAGSTSLADAEASTPGDGDPELDATSEGADAAGTDAALESPAPAAPVRGSRKGRASNSQRATN
ncbi:MAG TPA: hypothetical protein VMG12_38010 [Polyangiaceae bacterium]|nr:hypothetical protein [Polyangiaceae bacterium]